MGKHADNGSYTGPDPFSVGVIAPPGLDHPSLGPAVARTLLGLLARKHRTHRVGLYAVGGEPVGRAARAAGERYGWDTSYVGHPTLAPSRADHLRARVHVLTLADAAVVFHPGGPLPPDLAWLVAVAGRLGTAVRLAPVG